MDMKKLFAFISALALAVASFAQTPEEIEARKRDEEWMSRIIPSVEKLY